MAISTRAPEAAEIFARLPDRLPETAYNFGHFRFEHLKQDVERTLDRSGIPPGDLAPDFELPLVGGGTLRLSDLRGKPALLHFGSFT